MVLLEIFSKSSLSLMQLDHTEAESINSLSGWSVYFRPLHFGENRNIEGQ